MAAESEEVSPGPVGAMAVIPANRQKALLLAAGLALLIALTAAATTAIFSKIHSKPEPSRTQPVAATLPTTPDAPQLAQLRSQLESQAKTITQLQQELAQLRQSSVSSQQLQGVLASQERSFQQFLVGMKEGMTEIAHMVRGSRTWLEHYEYRLDEVIGQSEARARTLARGALEQPSKRMSQ